MKAPVKKVKKAKKAGDGKVVSGKKQAAGKKVKSAIPKKLATGKKVKSATPAIKQVILLSSCIP